MSLNTYHTTLNIYEKGLEL